MKKITLSLVVVLTMITTNAQNKLLSSIRESYFNGSWEKFSGENYEYDINNNLIEETYYNWNTLNASWEISTKTSYIYNIDNKVILEIQQDWNSLTNQLENDYKDTFTYNNGKLTGIQSQEWVDASWINEYQVLASYNGSSLLDVLVEYSWNGVQWVNEYRTTYAYDAIDKVISDIEQNWVGNQWVNYRKFLYNYNSNSKLISVQGADWDPFNVIWKADAENAYDYVLDTNGNRISSTESGYQTDYTYDTTQLMSNFAHPFKDKTGFDYFTADFPYINKLLSQTNNGGNGRTTYNYNSAITLSTDTFKKGVAIITVYPNPTSDYLNIQNESNTEIDKVTVTDLTGKKVLEQKQRTSQINVQNLAKGVYLLQAFSGKDKFQTKFVKK